MFTQNTAEKFRNGLPNPSPYVKEAIDPKNVKEGAELLEGIVKEFKRELLHKQIKGIKTEKMLPEFNDFKQKIDGEKNDILSLFKKYKTGNKEVSNNLMGKINQVNNYLLGISDSIINEKDFAYYYEIDRVKMLNNEIINFLNIK